ncbi:hypothetical protein [Rhizobium sp. SGZ-381]|uniref:hypothetical protein n=1 Tax=Rhizobium sp. SGZ-381 TaxID=3342800 RepID=UPI00366BE2B0
MQTKLTQQDHQDRAEMLRLYQDRGPMTQQQLLAAGFSLESQARNAHAVAEMVRETA